MTGELYSFATKLEHQTLKLKNLCFGSILNRIHSYFKLIKSIGYKISIRNLVENKIAIMLVLKLLKTIYRRSEK